MQKSLKAGPRGFYVPSQKEQEKERLYKRLDEVWEMLTSKKKFGLSAQEVENLRQEAGTIILKLAEIDEDISSQNEKITKRR